MCPVFASPTRWTTWHLPPTRCLRFRLSRWWLGSSKFWRPGGSCDFLTANVFFSVFIHNIYRESSSNALLSFILEAADGWFLHQSSRNRCLAALREELTLYETFPKWAHLPPSATLQKPPSASGLCTHQASVPTPLLVSKPLTLKLKPPAWTNTEQAATRSGPNFHNYVGGGVSQFLCLSSPWRVSWSLDIKYK